MAAYGGGSRRSTLVTAEGESVTLRRGERSQDHSRASRRLAYHDVAPRLQAARPIITHRFPRTRKNSSGYALDAYLASGDVLDLIIGAEGTLGIVTEIEWRLDQVPAFRAGLRVHLSSLDHLEDVVGALNHASHPPWNYWIDPFSSCSVRRRGQARGWAAIPRPSCWSSWSGATLIRWARLFVARARRLPAGPPPVDTAYSPPEAEQLWAISHAASPILAGLPENRRSLQVIEDGCVPVERMGEYIAAVRRSAAEHDLPVVMFGHAGDGHLHVNLLPELARKGWERAVASLLGR